MKYDKLDTSTFTPDNWRTVMGVVIRFDESGLSDYVQFLMDRGEHERAYHAFRIRACIYESDDEATLMSLLVKLAAWSVDGQVWVRQWGRDCDLMESDYCYRLPANLDAILEAENDMYDNAEGPCTLRLVSPEYAERFRPTRRDIAAEQMGY